MLFRGHATSRRQFLQTIAAGATGFVSAGHAWGQLPPPLALPALAAPERIDGPPVVSARGWAIADGRTGRFLWGNNEAAELVMASTTKIMTAYLVIKLAGEDCRVLDEVMTISARAAQTVGSSAQIRTGDQVTVDGLLYGLLLPSGNDAATAFAEHFGARLVVGQGPAPVQPVESFVAAMNRQAASWRLTHTRYFDPHGLGRNHTSPRDLTLLAWHAMQEPLFREIVRTRRRQYEITGADGTRRSQTWNNTNRLLDIEGYEGIKTGTTTAAGSCLVASGRHGDDHLIVAVLGCSSNDSRYVDARNLFRWAWRERR